MMNKVFIRLGTLLLLTLAVAAAAENISIGQIDSSSLLLSQEVKLYVSVTDGEGSPLEGLEREQFSVSESTDGNQFLPLDVEELKSGANKREGIHFLLLIDNSGSMYNTLAGGKTEDTSRMRITHARNALRNFIASITNPSDTVGLAYFNTYYVHLVEQTREMALIEEALDRIERPSPEDKEDYTELYAALTLAADKISNLPGRKVIIVLSDGRNEDYLSGTGQAHPVFGSRTYTYQEPIQSYQEEGISCFAIDFGGLGDKMLDNIAFESGGRVFQAANDRELSHVYKEIQDRILGEYLLVYRAGMQPADRKYVRLSYTDKAGNTEEVTRFYLASTLFGLPLESLGWLFLIPVLCALLLWFLLTRIKFIKPNKQPGLEVLGAGSATILTRTVPLENKATVIGGSEQANLTIAGVSSVKDNHATILFDGNTGSYTLVSDEEVSVNNQYVKRKKLEAGDVINVAGTTIVFDDEVEE